MQDNRTRKLLAELTISESPQMQLDALNEQVGVERRTREKSRARARAELDSMREQMQTQRLEMKRRKRLQRRVVGMSLCAIALSMGFIGGRLYWAYSEAVDRSAPTHQDAAFGYEDRD